MDINKFAGIVVDLCIKIHSGIGPGCFERERQILLPIEYDELLIREAYKLDLFLEKKLVLELKSVYPLPPVYFKQIHTHLSLLNLKHGMLINFKVDPMKDGIHRVFNNFGKEFL